MKQFLQCRLGTDEQLWHWFVVLFPKYWLSQVVKQLPFDINDKNIPEIHERQLVLLTEHEIQGFWHATQLTPSATKGNGQVETHVWFYCTKNGATVILHFKHVVVVFVQV